MQSTVSSRWQTVVPAEIRHRYHISEGDTLVWIDDGKVIRVVPVPSNKQAVIAALQGRAKGENLGEKLRSERNADRDALSS